MKSNPFVYTLLSFFIVFTGVEIVLGQALPATLALKVKLRDFNQVPSGSSKPYDPIYHPDFNSFDGCYGKGYVSESILLSGKTDTGFANDNRNPELINPKAGCYTGVSQFNQWYNDDAPSINRSFKTEIVLTPIAPGSIIYQYKSNLFFPLDESLVGPPPKPTNPIVPGTTTFRDSGNGDDGKFHNFGFTTEFHAMFTYLKEIKSGPDARPAQKFVFSGDDDVWVFINGKLAVDIGGLHSEEKDSIILDSATALRLGLLKSRDSYFLDFFLAERHVTQSNFTITTSLQLETQKLPLPTSTPPGRDFSSVDSASFSNTIPGVTLRYTTNGTTPTETSPIYTQGTQFKFYNDTTFKVVAFKEEWSPSEVLEAKFTKTLTPSLLQFLVKDATNKLVAPPLGYLTEMDLNYFITLTTTQINLTSINDEALTRVNADQEIFTVTGPQNLTSKISFTGSSPFTVGKATKANGSVEATDWDSLTVRWVNPKMAKDTVRTSILIRPTRKQATAYFSTKPDGSDTTKSYLVTTKTVYMVVNDQALNPTKTYTAAITSEVSGTDKETVNLVPVPGKPGKLIGAIGVTSDFKIPGDTKLQVGLSGDQLKMVYIDPVDGDSAVAKTGFAAFVQEPTLIQFTDAAGVALPPGTIWSPHSGMLYFSYSDDYYHGAIATQQVSLTLVDKKYGTVIATDHEKIALSLTGTYTESSTKGLWIGSINLADAFPVTGLNGTAETHFRGEATVSVLGHRNDSTPDPTGPVTDFLLIANPDTAAALDWKLADPTPKNPEGLIFTVKDQSYSSGRDTALISVGCTKSGDSVAAFGVVESLPTSGLYTSGILIKDEGTPSFADQNLSCAVTDQIRIHYIDPVYGTLSELVVNEVGKPVANPPGGKFVTSVLVTLTSATPGAKIYYTLDGKIPLPGVRLEYTDPLRINNTTTVTVIAVLPGYKDSKVLTQTYAKETVASRLEILDENGNQISNNTLTGASKSIRIKLVTTQDGLTTNVANIKTLGSNDAETLPLGHLSTLGNAFEYWQEAVLSSPDTKTAGNFVIEANSFDTLTVKWQNPFLSSDSASAILYIKPAFVAAEVYFSLSEGGPRISTYPVTQDSIFVVVKTRPKDPALTYTIEISSTEIGVDKETLVLKELSPGVFSTKAPVSTGAKTLGDKIIQVAVAGDQLTAIFVDPVYKDIYRGDVGFAQQVQESTTLEFIDDKGNLVGPTEIWSPANGKVFLRYTDDWNAGIDLLVHTKTVRLTETNSKAGVLVGTDSESVVLTLVGTPTGTKGTWEGSLTLEDKNPTVPHDGKIQTYYHGELVASVTPHNNSGTSSGNEVQDKLIIAYPNLPGEIVIADPAGNVVSRQTEKVVISITDQLITKFGDASIEVAVSCVQSGDKVSNLTLMWDGTKYVNKVPLDKGEINSGSLDKNDALLLCRDSDILVVTYIDPVYLDQRTAEVRWNDLTVSRMYYASTKDSAAIPSVSEAVSSNFLIIVEGKSPNRDKVDTMWVELTTAQGENERLPAIETGALTGKFIVKVDYLFRSADPTKDDKKVEAKITLANRVNQLILNGEVDIGGEKIKSDLSLISVYNQVAKAYIKDLDENGRADHVYLVLDHKLPALPSSLESVYWNKVEDEFSKKATSSMMSFLPASDSSIIVIDFTSAQFGANLTGIPDGEHPYVLLPDDNLFAGQKPGLADSIGPVIVTATKLPSNLGSYNFTGTEKRFNPDTLKVTLSEKIKTTTASFDGMLRFAKGCTDKGKLDYNESVPLKTFNEPTVSSNGLVWTVIVDNTPDSQTPLVGDCIFLEVDGRYVDVLGNLPAHLGVVLEGENPKLVIRSFRGYPPVAGVDAETPGFILVTNENRKGETGTYSTQSGNGKWDVLWIPPYGFDAHDPVGSLQGVANDFTHAQSQDRKAEQKTPQPFPDNISAVQVITSGAYKAQIHIYDNLGHFVRYMEQSYGMNGEDKNPWRASEKGQLSFLVWDLKDKDGQLAGQGVYVWKVNFNFIEKNTKSEVRFTRTGVMRNN